MPSAPRVLAAVPVLALTLVSCGGDAQVSNPAPVAHSPADASFTEAEANVPSDAPDASLDASPDARLDASDARLDSSDADDGPLSDAEAGSDVEVPDDPPPCTATATVTIEAQMRKISIPAPGVVVTSHCADGRFFRKTTTDALGEATIEVPLGGLVTAACDRLNPYGVSSWVSLLTIGGVNAGGTLPFDCGYGPPPGGRPPTPPSGSGYDYEVDLEPFAGAASYQIRGNAGEADSSTAGPVTVHTTPTGGTGDIVAYALDAQGHRIASAFKLAAPLQPGTTVAMEQFDHGVYPTGVTLVHPPVEQSYQFAATIETWRNKMLEKESITSFLSAGDTASMSVGMAFDAAERNDLHVVYLAGNGNGSTRSELFVERTVDDLPFEFVVDLTDDMLPAMRGVTLAPATRPVLTLDPDGPASCLAGPADGLFVTLRGTHPDGYSASWYLVLPPDTTTPFELPELGTTTMQKHWPGDLMAMSSIVVSQYAYESLEPHDVMTGWWAIPQPSSLASPTCVSRLEAK